MRYSDKYFQICRPQGRNFYEVYSDNYFFYKDKIYLIHNEPRQIMIYTAIAMSIFLCYPLIMNKLDVINATFTSYLENHFYIKIILIIAGIFLTVFLKALSKKYSCIYLERKGKLAIGLPNVDWKKELRFTRKIILAYVAFWLIGFATAFFAFYMNWMGFFIAYFIISAGMGAVSGNHSFSQRIKFQKKMIAETNNRLELKKM